MNPTTNTSVVYVIQCGLTDFLKIGYSENLQKRIDALQGGSPYPLRVLATWPGGSELESYLHQEFAELRHAGEWFCFPPCRRIEIYNAVMVFNIETGGRFTAKQSSRKRSFTNGSRVAFLRPQNERRKKSVTIEINERPPMACSCPTPRIAYTEWKISGGQHRYRIMMDRWFENGVAKYARSEWFPCTCRQMQEWRRDNYDPIVENVRRVREEYLKSKQ